MDVICGAVPLAVSPLHGNRVDVSRGLRSSWLSHISEEQRGQLSGMAYVRSIGRSIHRWSQICRCEQGWHPRMLSNGHTGVGPSLLRRSAGSPPLENRGSPIVESDHCLSAVAVSDSRAWEKLIQVL